MLLKTLTTTSLLEYLLFYLDAIPHTISFSIISNFCFSLFSEFHKQSYQSQEILEPFLRHQESFLSIYPCHNNSEYRASFVLFE